jgi:hypothetical protein
MEIEVALPASKKEGEAEPTFPPIAVIPGDFAAEEIPHMAAHMASRLAPEGWGPGELRPIFEDFLKAWRKDQLRKQEVEEQLRGLVLKLSDIGRWKTLERADRKAYRSELTSFLRECKSCLNRACKIESHRRADREKLELVRQIKDGHPEFSFGQVALEYAKQTGKPMTAKIAERTYSRAKLAPLFFDFDAHATKP